MGCCGMTATSPRVCRLFHQVEGLIAPMSPKTSERYTPPYDEMRALSDGEVRVEVEHLSGRQLVVGTARPGRVVEERLQLDRRGERREGQDPRVVGAGGGGDALRPRERAAGAAQGDRVRAGGVVDPD